MWLIVNNTAVKERAVRRDLYRAIIQCKYSITICVVKCTVIKEYVQYSK